MLPMRPVRTVTYVSVRALWYRRVALSKIQRGMAERNANVPADTRLELRIGISVGGVGSRIFCRAAIAMSV
jgi:hypothetical protein